MAITKSQILFLGGAVALSAALFLVPRKADQEPKSGSAFSVNSFDRLIEGQKKGIEKAQLERITLLEKAFETKPSDVSLLDSISLAYDKQKKPAIAAYYCEKKAVKSQAEQDWLNAAYRYFDGMASSEDSSSYSAFLNKAISCYSKVIEKNPSNLNAKTDLGLCYSKTANPMKGILLLKEVVAANPQHENAQMNLGMLAVKSGQIEKAVERFKKVNEINPAREDVLLYLAECSERLGENKEAVKYLSQFKKVTKDETSLKEVDAYIEKLKRS